MLIKGAFPILYIEEDQTISLSNLWKIKQAEVSKIIICFNKCIFGNQLKNEQGRVICLAWYTARWQHSLSHYNNIMKRGEENFAQWKFKIPTSTPTK